MALLLFLLSLICAAVAIYLLGLSTQRNSTSLLQRCMLRLVAVFSAYLTLLGMQVVMAPTQAIFAWLGVLSLAATLLVLMQPLISGKPTQR